MAAPTEYQSRVRQAGRIIRWLDLINFTQITDWCARVPGTPVIDEERRKAALRDLVDAAHYGAFGPPDRPAIAFLSDGAPPHYSWRTRTRLLPGQIRYFPPEFVFVRKPPAAQWFNDYGYPLPPWLKGIDPGTPTARTIEGHVAEPFRLLKLAEQPPCVPTDRSGAPGRPSSMHLVEAEMTRRATSGEMLLTSCAKEAAALEGWLKQAHPLLRPTTAKAIKNQLGQLYRRLRESIPKTLPQ